jgi:integrase
MTTATRSATSKTWKKACGTTGVSGLIVHDLRRSAVRNLIRAGIPERVAMAFSGHKTRAIFDRYSIVRESDLAEAAERLHAHVESAKSRATVVSTMDAATSA